MEAELRALDLRSEATVHPRLAQVVRQFFAHASQGAWAQAAALASDPLDLFGTPIGRAELARNDDRSLSETLVGLHELPPGITFSGDEQAQLFGGALGEGCRVCFATLTLDGQQSVSYGLVVALHDAATPRIVRLFDPGPFKRFAEDLTSARRAGGP